jgi:phosphopantetheinyl transferase (holo-ACP synthase)
LEKEISKYQAREDYLSVALEDQASRFSLIVGSLLALVTLITFTGFYAKVHVLKKKYTKKTDRLNKEFSKYKSEMNTQNILSSISNGNINTLAADNYKRSSELFMSFEYFLAAARHHSRAIVLIKEDKDDDEQYLENTCKYARICMNSSLKSLQLILDDESKLKKYESELKESNSRIDKDLEAIFMTKDKELIELSSLCRVKINEWSKSLS